MKLEWKNCGREADEAPVRGSVIRSIGFFGVAWTFDGSVVFAVPVVNGRAVHPRNMKQLPRRDVTIVGVASKRTVDSIRNSVDVEVKHNSTPYGWEVLISDDSSQSMPGSADGWLPISMSDGTYWRIPSFARGD